MSRRYPPGDNPTNRDDDEFDAGPRRRASQEDDDDAVGRPVRWWNKEVSISPLIPLGIAIAAALVVLFGVYASKPRQAAPPQQNAVIQAPVRPAAAPEAVDSLEPGHQCVISNLRKAHSVFGGFGGQPNLMFDYKFPRSQPFAGPRFLVVVVTKPGGVRATSMSAFTDEQGTVSLASLDAVFGGESAFPPGTNVYVGDQINDGPDGLPKRVSNTLYLEQTEPGRGGRADKPQ